MSQFIEDTLQQGLLLMKPIMQDYVDPIVTMNTINAVQMHYRKALESPRVCPVCEDSACQIKSLECGK